jgi:hypothetical protein
MKLVDEKFKEQLTNEIVDSNMTLDRKLKVLKLLDQAFRKYLGTIYLSDQDLEEKDILFRSM